MSTKKRQGLSSLPFILLLTEVSPFASSVLLFEFWRRAEIFTGDVKFQFQIICSVRDRYVIPADGDVFLAHAQETANADHNGHYLAVRVDNQIIDGSHIFVDSRADLRTHQVISPHTLRRDRGDMAPVFGAGVITHAAAVCSFLGVRLCALVLTSVIRGRSATQGIFRYQRLPIHTLAIR